MGSSRRRCFFAKTQPSANPVPFPLASNMRGLALEAAGAAVKGQGAIVIGKDICAGSFQNYASGGLTDQPRFVSRAAVAGKGAAVNTTDGDGALDDVPRSLAHFERAAAPSCSSRTASSSHAGPADRPVFEAQVLEPGRIRPGPFEAVSGPLEILG